MKRGCPDHPKMDDLAALLSIPKYAANGLIERLFHFTAQYAPQGNVGKHSDIRIARALNWHQPAQDWRKDSRDARKGAEKACALIDALVAAEWLERCPTCRLYLHDWHEHRDNSVKKYLERNGLTCLHNDGTCLGGVQDMDSLPLPSPLPSAGGQDPPAPSPPTADSDDSTDAQKVIAAMAAVGVQVGNWPKTEAAINADLRMDGVTVETILELVEEFKNKFSHYAFIRTVLNTRLAEGDDAKPTDWAEVARNNARWGK